jgi:hypothetical protein
MRGTAPRAGQVAFRIVVPFYRPGECPEQAKFSMGRTVALFKWLPIFEMSKEENGENENLIFL